MGLVLGVEGDGGHSHAVLTDASGTLLGLGANDDSSDWDQNGIAAAASALRSCVTEALSAAGSEAALVEASVFALAGVDFPVDERRLAGIPEATAALQNGNCVAFLYDNTWIESQLAGDPQWADYEMPLETEDPQAWAVAVPLDQLEGPYGDFMRETVTDWHRSGQLIELNREWGIQDNPFLEEMHEKHKSS